MRNEHVHPILRSIVNGIGSEWEIPIEPEGEVETISGVIIPANIKMRVDGGFARYKFASYHPDEEQKDLEATP